MRAAHKALHERVALGSGVASNDGAPSTSDVLEFRGVAFATLAAIVARTQSRIDFFNAFFFKQSPDKDEYPWERIVDCDVQHTFGVETNFAHRSWQQLVAADLADPMMNCKSHISFCFRLAIFLFFVLFIDKLFFFFENKKKRTHSQRHESGSLRSEANCATSSRHALHLDCVPRCNVAVT